MSNRSYFVYSLTFILAACSILYELTIAQTISILSANTVGRYSLTIGIYLGTMGLGALLCDRIFKKKPVWFCLFFVEILLSISGSLCVFLIYFSHMVCSYFYNAYSAAVLFFFIPSICIVALIGFLTGLELPLLIRIGNNLTYKKKITNRILGVDYIGALAGALLFPLLLLPHISVLKISSATALINLFAAIAILLFCCKEIRFRIAKLGGAALLLTILLVSFIYIDGVEQYFLKKYYFFIEASENLSTFIKPMDSFSDVERFRSAYQKIDIVKSEPYKDPYTPLLNEAYSTKFSEDPNFPRDYFLFLNGEYQIGSDYEDIYHEYFAHIPIIINGQIPKKVLVLGGGDGMLSRELLKYSKIEHIVQVELDKKMIDVANTHPVLRYLNKGSQENPKVEIIIADAYQFVKNNNEQFDAIFIDFPYPIDYNLSKLFSREFYHFVKKRLKDDGFAVIDAPGSDLFFYSHEDKKMRLDEDNDWKIYYNTLSAAGFSTVVPFVSNLEYDNPLVLDIFAEVGVQNPAIDLNKISSEQMEHIEDLKKGFIFVKKRDEDMLLTYKDPKIKLHVLNEKRFYLAFAMSSLFSYKKNVKLINTIMRPTFPSISFWDIRLPF